MLSEQRARLSTVVILLTVLGAPGLSADPLPGSEDGAAQPTAETADDSPARASSETRTQEPVEPFVPSESISADSAVAFPVDI